jgi:hypothetical protein
MGSRNDRFKDEIEWLCSGEDAHRGEAGDHRSFAFPESED